MGHPPYSSNLAFYSSISRKNAWSIIFVARSCGNSSIFWRCLNRSGKTNTNDDRTSKHSEHCYAEQCQTFLWQCQILDGNTRNMLGQKFMYWVVPKVIAGSSFILPFFNSLNFFFCPLLADTFGLL